MGFRNSVLLTMQREEMRDRGYSSVFVMSDSYRNFQRFMAYVERVRDVGGIGKDDFVIRDIETGELDPRPSRPKSRVRYLPNAVLYVKSDKREVALEALKGYEPSEEDCLRSDFGKETPDTRIISRNIERILSQGLPRKPTS